jgi:hypothetical protein
MFRFGVISSGFTSGSGQASMFFFEKKNQKTFASLGFGHSGEAQPSIAKVFCFFFSKKKTFLPLTVSGAAICA